MQALLRRLGVPSLIALLVALVCPAQAQSVPTVRVRLFGGPSLGEVSLTSTDAPLTLTMDGRVVATLAPGVAVQIDRSSGGRVNLEGEGPGGERINERGAVLEAEAGPADGGGAVRVRGGRYDRRYRGRIVVTQASSTRLLVVNAVPLTDYVASVTAHEYPFSEIEGVKAQAVLARTYVLQRAGAGGTYDVDDHQGSQVYEGVGAETAVSREATRATFGQVLRYNGAFIEAVYSSSSGGHTADNETVWGTTPLPYLRGRPDPYDAEAPDHSWRVAVDAGRVFAALSGRYGRVTDVTVAERSREGRAVRVRLTGDRGQTVSATDFRAVVNARLGGRTLRSTHFSIAREGSQLVFTGRGFGHGVGMSQYGARGQARAGRSYTEILSFYFAGAVLDALPHARGPAPAMPTSSGAPALASASRPISREPVPVVRGTWGPPRSRPMPRAEAHAAEATAATRAAAAPAPRPATRPAVVPASPTPRRRAAW